MTPAMWAITALAVLVLCWLAGIFIAIAQFDDVGDDEAEDLLRKANTDLTYRPRLRADDLVLPSLHRTHYEP